MIHTYTIDSFAGWVIVLILFGLMLRQAKETRRLHSLLRAGGKDLPPLSILIDASAGAPSRDAILAAANQIGIEPQILVGLSGNGTAASEIGALRLVHPNVEPLPLDAKRPAFEQLLDLATGEIVLCFDSSVVLEPEAVRIIVSRMLETRPARAIALTAAISKSLLAGFGTFTDLTMGIGPFDAGEVARTGRIALVDRNGDDDGYDWIDATAVASTAKVSSGVFTQRSSGIRLLIAFALVLLFTAPLVAAVVTRQFSFVVATVLGIWLRLRISTRTGEPVESALIQPLTAALVAVSIVMKR